jgi:hypothetical protein
MVTASPASPPPASPGPLLEPARIAILRKKIDNEDYLCEAIQRIAQVLSNEILDIPQGGSYHERQGR